MTTQDYVLIAEPDARLAMTFESIASDQNLPAVIAVDGAVARGVIQKRGLPVLVITNLVLPKLDGFGLLEDLRRVAPASEVPALAVSSSMELRTTANNARHKLGIAEVAASSMGISTLRTLVMRALATSARIKRSAPAQTPIPQRPAPVARPLPSRDPQRSARISAMGLVDDLPPDQTLQRLVEETARNFGVPIALVSLILDKRQWFKAYYGLSGQLLDDRGTPVEQSFCRHVVDAETPAPLVIPDAAHHPLFADNDFVKAGQVGSYAGAPLLTPDGTVLGTLCIVDSKPLSIDNHQVVQLVALARRVAGELELRSSARRSSRGPGLLPSEPPPDLHTGRASAEYLEAVLANLEVGVMLLDAERTITFVNAALCSMVGADKHKLLGRSRQSFVERLAAHCVNPEDTLRRLAVHSEGPFLAREELELTKPVRRVLRWVAKPVRLPGGVAQLATYTDITTEADMRAQVELVSFVENDD